MGKRIAFVLVFMAAALLLVVPVAMAFSISVTSVDPPSARANTTVHCTIHGSFGTGLTDGTPQFELVQGLTTIAGSTGTFDGTSASVVFTLPGDSLSGSCTVHASQWHAPFSYAASLADGFLVLTPAPVVSTTNPTSAATGSGDLTLTVYGHYFRSSSLVLPPYFGSTVQWNGVDLLTTYNSDTVLTATIPAAQLVTPGTASVTVSNYTDGTLSNGVWFTITAPTPTITALDPTSAVVGGPAFNLVVTGANFVTGATGAVVRWNGADLVTTRDSATHLTAAVPAPLIAALGSASITVRNGTAPAAPLSNALPFTVGNAVPALTTITPTQVWAGYVKNDVVLTVNGSNFVTGAHIFLSGGEKTGTTFVSATQLTVPLMAADIATPGSLTVSVKNPPFPPGTSSLGALPLVVAAETTNPTVTIAGADSAWHNAPVALTFSATDSQSGVQKVQYQSPPTVAAWTDGAAYTVPVTSQGAITVNAQALDWCNRVGSASATVYIDITKPETTALGNVSVKKGKTAKLKYKIAEPADLSPTANVVIKIKRSNGTTAKTITIDSAPMNVERIYSFRCNLAKGSYKWYVYATDLAGNTQDNVAKASLKVK
ncbi:MAG: IPT/TIG domain-containing protein [Actinobacteria bacterium]|nr:IPT/TIG domain-containing protein [Actinomycetota bacterium]